MKSDKFGLQHQIQIRNLELYLAEGIDGISPQLFQHFAYPANENRGVLFNQ